MSTNIDPQILNEQGKQAFQSGELEAGWLICSARLQRRMPPPMMISMLLN